VRGWRLWVRTPRTAHLRVKKSLDLCLCVCRPPGGFNFFSLIFWHKGYVVVVVFDIKLFSTGELVPVEKLALNGVSQPVLELPFPAMAGLLL